MPQYLKIMKHKIFIAFLIFFIFNPGVFTNIIFGQVDSEDSILRTQIPKKNILIDIDGNVYKTVIIGNHEWMAENLKTTTYNDGTIIPYIDKDSAWVGLYSDAYSWYNNNENNADRFGALYNWFAVNNGKICPDGWRVPTDEEWKFLESYVDTRYGPNDPVWDKTNFRGYDAGQRLMASSGWKSNGNGTNDFGFSAFPGGERLKNSQLIGSNGFWWSSTEYDTTSAWYRGMTYGVEDVSRNIHPKRMGFSVRCLKDK